MANESFLAEENLDGFQKYCRVSILVYWISQLFNLQNYRFLTFLHSVSTASSVANKLSIQNYLRMFNFVIIRIINKNSMKKWIVSVAGTVLYKNNEIFSNFFLQPS